jgi:hypothetical protein
LSRLRTRLAIAAGGRARFTFNEYHDWAANVIGQTVPKVSAVPVSLGDAVVQKWRHNCGG